jgi:hypothetical protein
MAKLIRCLCGKVYDSTTVSRCPDCGADSPNSATPAYTLLPQSPPPYQPPPAYQPPPVYATPPPLAPTEQWVLTGRSLDGRSVRLELTDLLFSANGNKIVIGRTPELCHLVITDSSISKQHAHIRREGAGFFLVDRNSANGTAVNGQFNHKPFEELPLRTGDTLTLGEVKLDFARA